MGKTLKALALTAITAAMACCLAACGGSDSSAASGSAVSSPAASETAASAAAEALVSADAISEETGVASESSLPAGWIEEDVVGITLGMPETMPDFEYLEEVGVWRSLNADATAMVAVSDYVEVEPSDTLDDIDPDFIAQNLLSEYTDFDWDFFYEDIELSKDASCNFGHTTMRNTHTGIEVEAYVYFFDYSFDVMQYLLVTYMPSAHTELGDDIDVFNGWVGLEDGFVEYATNWILENQ